MENMLSFRVRGGVLYAYECDCIYSEETGKVIYAEGSYEPADGEPAWGRCEWEPDGTPYELELDGCETWYYDADKKEWY